MAHLVLRGQAASHLVRASILALLAAVLVARPAHAQDPGDGDDQLWAGDDGWSTTAPPQPAANNDWDQPAEQPAAEPPPDYQSNSQPDYGGVDTTAPRYADFQEGLAPYGQWIYTPEYGRVWRPAQVDAGWRPYLDGRWVFTSYGWTWVGNEPWGWATYHYGRWLYSPAFGWSWVPGRVWAPAWVSWRYGGGACGWAPLGPRGVVYVEPTRYVFVQTQHFTQPIRTYAIPSHQTYAVWGRMAPLPMTRPGLRSGPSVSAISRAVGRQVPMARMQVAATPRASQLNGGTVHIYKPQGVPFRPHAAASRAPFRPAPSYAPAQQGGSAAVPSRPSQRPQVQPRPRSDNWQPQPQQQQRPQAGWNRPSTTSEPRPQAREPRPPTYFGGVPSPGVIQRNRPEAQRAEPRPQARPTGSGSSSEKKKHE